MASKKHKKRKPTKRKIFSPTLADKIIFRSINELSPSAKNPRVHSRDQIDQIAASIVEFGFTNPLLIRADGTIIAGHGRLMAARTLELDELPVIVLDYLTDKQARALIIADNKLALNASWDDDLLHAEIAALEAESFDINLLGFSSTEINGLLSVGVPEMDEGNIPEPASSTITRPGEVWYVGDHKLFLGEDGLESIDDFLNRWSEKYPSQEATLDGKMLSQVRRERMGNNG